MEKGIPPSPLSLEIEGGGESHCSECQIDSNMERNGQTGLKPVLCRRLSQAPCQSDILKIWSEMVHFNRPQGRITKYMTIFGVH